MEKQMSFNRPRVTENPELLISNANNCKKEGKKRTGKTKSLDAVAKREEQIKENAGRDERTIGFAFPNRREILCCHTRSEKREY